MRNALFTLILLTVTPFAGAQRDSIEIPVRLIVTTNYQRHLLGRDPLWRSWPEGSLSRAMSYVEAWRREMGEEHVVLVNVGEEVEDVYRLYPEDLIARAWYAAGYADSTTLLPAAEVERLAAALDPRGSEIAVVDFAAPGVYEARTVDISGFPAEAAWEDRFQALGDSLRAYYDTPIAHLAAPAPQTGFLFGPTAYTALFHRFQLETGGADFSFFAVPRREEGVSAGELTFGDVLRRFRYDNELITLELTGNESRRYLEYTYGLRYNTMRRPTDDLLRLSRDRDGVLQTRSAVYNLDEAAGIVYEVDVTRPAGRRVRIESLADGAPFEQEATYRVALNSHRLNSGYLTRATGLSAEQIAARVTRAGGGDLRLLLRNWLEAQGEIAPASLGNWLPIPAVWVEPARNALDDETN